MQDEMFALIDKAIEGDKKALEEVLISVQDMIYNLSLRILGMPCDAEDATQEILLKVMTQLSTFKKESAFSTWVYRIATNHLINYKKSMFAQRPLSFEFYGADIEQGFIANTDSLTQGVDENLLAEELKQSCTNVMLQCLDPESRVIYVLGAMFKIDSKVCGEILGISPEAYRQRLSRIRKRVGEFLGEYCGISKTGTCDCRKRVGYAIETKRLNPRNLEYSNMKRIEPDKNADFVQAMEQMDELSLIFAELPTYQTPDNMKKFVERLLSMESMAVIRGEG